jgi:rhomboid protease GluP
MASCAACGTDLGEGAVARPDGLFLCDACNARVHPPDEPAAIRSASVTTSPPQPPLPWVTYGIVGANALMFLAMMVSIGTQAFNPTSEALLGFGADYGPETVLKGQYWRIITSMFAHAGIFHIFMNMYVLLDVGPVAEMLYGRRRFVCLYMLAGIGGALGSLWWNPAVVSVGASGAIFGVVGAMLAFSQHHKDKFSPEMLKRHTKSIFLFVAYNVGFGLMIPGIDNAAHMGGLVSGFLAGAALVPDAAGARRSPWRTVAGLVAFALVFGIAAEKLDWRVRNSPSVARELKRETFVSYFGDIRSLLAAQDELGPELDRALAGQGGGTADVLAATRANLDAFRHVQVSDPEIAGLNAVLVQRGEALLALAEAAAKPPDAASVAVRDAQRKRFNELTEQFTQSVQEFLKRHGLKKR